MKFSLLVAPVMAMNAGNAAIDKILQMLGDMEARGKKEKQEEQVAFAKFNTWCDNTQAEKAADIKASKDAITQYQAQIEQAQAQAAEAQDAIDEAVATIQATTDDLAAMKKVRQAENTAFISEKTDLQDSIYASEKAIETLSAVPEKVEAASSFLQTAAKKISSKRWSSIQSLLETVQKAENPFTSASEKRSNVVIDMLEKLKEEFSTELQTATKDEADKKHSYDMAVQEGNQVIDANKKLQKEKEGVKSEAEAQEGASKKDLATEEQSLADDKKYLAEITADCDLKKKDFGERQKSRTAELQAIAEAVSILKSPAVQTGAGHLDKAQSVGSFLQIKKSDNNSEKIVQFLRSRATAIHSSTLMQLAELATADPFVKIRKMIQELITRLEEEAKAELTKKGKCDKDMAENKAKIEEFTNLVEKLTAEVETLESEVAESKATKKRLTEEIAENRKNEAEAKKARVAEKSENEKVISESKAALEALDQAMAVLQNYYSQVKGAFIQTKAKQPEFSAGKYEGMGGDGVMGLLEVVKSQTDQLIRETTQAESNAATAHDEFITESQSSLSEKTTLLRSTEQTLAQKKEDLSDKKDALNGDDGAKSQLAAYTKEKNEVIDPQCTVQGVSFEERNKKREEEIQSLTEALDILGQMAP